MPILLFLGLFLFGVEASAGELPASVAVLPLKAKGKADRSVLEVLDDLLLSSMQSAAGDKLRVIGKSDIDAMLGFEKTKDALGCNEIACAAELAGALGVDSLVSPTAGTLGKKYLLTLVWIDQKKATVLKRHTEDLGSEIEGFDLKVRAAVATMFGVSSVTTPAPAAPPPPLASTQVSSEGLLAAWLPKESSGELATDASGKNHVAKLTNGARIQSGGPRGAGSVLGFDGDDDMAVVARAPALEPKDAATIALWAKIEKSCAGGYADIYRQAAAYLPGLLLRWSQRDGHLQLLIGRKSGWIAVRDPRDNAAYLGAWHHFAATIDTKSGAARLYVDGELVAVASLAGELEYTDHVYLMHSPHQDQFPIPGQLHDVRLYGRALSSAEVTQLARR